MSPRSRLMGLGALAVVLASSPLWTPPLLRRIDWFDVRRVEVSGTRLLAPHEVLAASRVSAGQSVWDDARGWEAQLLAHPAVAEARISRKLPHTLRVRIEEKRPVAYLEGETLRPATAAGELLPVDPTRAQIDLPILRAAALPAGEERRRSERLILAETGRLGRLDPGLLATVSEIRRGGADQLVLVLSEPALEVVLPMGVDAARLAQLRSVLSDLARRYPAAGEGAGSAEGLRVDLRFEDQIVVRHPSSV